jgi:hypothetical protein
MKLSLEHIDPKNHSLISGFSEGPLASFNEIIADHSYNSKKQNRFVPYRVKDYPAPINEGDLAEFLINGEWVVCPFAVKNGNWWKEANRIGCGSTVKPTEEQKAKMKKPKSNVQNMRKPKSKTHCQNMSGSRNNQYGKRGELSPNYGKIHTIRHNESISKGKTGGKQYVNALGEKRVFHEDPGPGWQRGWTWKG